MLCVVIYTTMNVHNRRIGRTAKWDDGTTIHQHAIHCSFTLHNECTIM